MATASPRATNPLLPWPLPARNRRKAPIFAAMKLTEVNDARTLRDWTRLPWRIYANDRNWVPHLKQDVEKVFDPAKNKLLVEGRITRWVLYADDGSTIGRIAAFVNPKTAHTDRQQPTGGCGFFECIDDQAAANMLFDAARDWLKAQGMEAMDGPINLGERNMFWGLLIENFTDPPIYGTNYNPPYYVKLFEAYGFGLYFKQLFLPHERGDRGASPSSTASTSSSRTIRTFPCATCVGCPWSRSRRTSAPCYNAAWVDHENFKPMSAETALKAIRPMKPVMDPRIVVFVYHKQKPIAFYINLPELNEIFRHVNGDLNLDGQAQVPVAQMARHSEDHDRHRVRVVKEWQGKGVEGAMIVHTSNMVDARARLHRHGAHLDRRLQPADAEGVREPGRQELPDPGHLPLPLRPQQAVRAPAHHREEGLK
jgi:hypothetical protein